MMPFQEEEMALMVLGVYPYLPSGLVLSPEINSGPNGEGQLLVLDPEYEEQLF